MRRFPKIPSHLSNQQSKASNQSFPHNNNHTFACGHWNEMKRRLEKCANCDVYMCVKRRKREAERQKRHPCKEGNRVGIQAS